MGDASDRDAVPGVVTDPGRHAALFDGLPTEVAGLARVTQGLLVHELMVGAYGRTVTEEERAAVHVRRIEELLERVVAIDDRPLTEKRPPADRVVGNCRHFTVLLVAMLRAQGRPARARCGFGGYFNTGTFEDHWVAECWNDTEQRWHLVDAQIDRHQLTFFPIDFDVLDVPRDRFLTGGDAWVRCRAGDADPGSFGLTFTGEFGSWWIAQNLVRDAAALGGVEVLPWDRWGAMPTPHDVIDDELSALFDRLAACTNAVAMDGLAAGGMDGGVAAVRELMRSEARLRVPPVVRNATRQRDELI